MSNIPEQLRYAASHEWIKVDGDIGTVGISDHAQHELSDVVYVDLPKAGAKLAAGTVAAVVESVKAASDIYSPVSGEVVEVNAALLKKPELVNTDPYGAAWLFRLKLSVPTELAALKDAAGYKAQVGE
ncbi:MAG TPA: glycine cleavage system protein GcvH [Candidatus Methylacidiphilales bacterium]|jgi:glycine cleavage system H protein|nr:glycine cleavage system protein GcvH [Candidatus Methylacidiphilales bacterium]